jgi:hypothetical protein
LPNNPKSTRDEARVAALNRRMLAESDWVYDKTAFDRSPLHLWGGWSPPKKKHERNLTNGNDKD